MKSGLGLIVLLWVCMVGELRADLVSTVSRVKASVVGVGTLQQLRRPPFLMRGTGFVVADGRHIITNAHVLPEVLDNQRNEVLAIAVGQGEKAEIRTVQTVSVDTEHDLALLRMDGAALPALALGGELREGEAIAFTGFPIGAVLGPYPVTHRGIVSAISPIAIPQPSSRALDPAQIRRIRSKPFSIYQLDATAYPGNSGGPLYHPETGLVSGVVNATFIKETKEKALSAPSGISYAIPVEYVKALLARSKLQ